MHAGTLTVSPPLPVLPFSLLLLQQNGKCVMYDVISCSVDKLQTHCFLRFLLCQDENE